MNRDADTPARPERIQRYVDQLRAASRRRAAGTVCTCPRDDPYQRDCPVHGEHDEHDEQDWPEPDQPVSYLGGGYTTPRREVKVPRWDQDKTVLANGWTAGRCGSCGEDLTEHDRAVQQAERERHVPVAFLVAEQRDGRWVFGDDWVERCDALAEAQQVADRWRAHDYNNHPIGVFAVCQVPDV